MNLGNIKNCREMKEEKSGWLKVKHSFVIAKIENLQLSINVYLHVNQIERQLAKI